VDYQTRISYQGGAWYTIEAGDIPVVLLVRGGAVIPHSSLVQHTAEITWDEVTLRAFGSLPDRPVQALLALPGGQAHTVGIAPGPEDLQVDVDPFDGAIRFLIEVVEPERQ
jgi:alpha-D-xyloside xylohydrolase